MQTIDQQKLIAALSWLGVSTPDSKEECAAKQDELLSQLIDAVLDSKLVAQRKTLIDPCPHRRYDNVFDDGLTMLQGTPPEAEFSNTEPPKRVWLLKWLTCDMYQLTMNKPTNTASEVFEYMPVALHEIEKAALLTALRDCESYAGAMAVIHKSGEGAQLAARCRETIAKTEGATVVELPSTDKQKRKRVALMRLSGKAGIQIYSVDCFTQEEAREDYVGESGYKADEDVTEFSFDACTGDELICFVRKGEPT